MGQISPDADLSPAQHGLPVDGWRRFWTENGTDWRGRMLADGRQMAFADAALQPLP